MNGLLIYNNKDIERNSWFIDAITKEFSFHNVSLTLLDEELIDFKNIKTSFAIYRGRNYKIVRKLQNKGIQVFNNDLVSELANDKYKTYKFLKKNNIKCLKSSLNENRFKTFPVIAKTRNGHGGTEVFLCKNPLELQDIQKSYSNLMYQEYVKEGFKDLRAYVMGNEVISTILRTSKDNFKSNFSLGGEFNKIESPKKVISICKKIRKLIKSDYIGIDFFEIDGNWIVNEIEDPVGSRMLYWSGTTDFMTRLCNYYLGNISLK